MLCQVFGFPLVSVCTRTHFTSLCRNPLKQYIMELHDEFQNSGAILEHLFFDIASNIIILRMFLQGNHKK